MVPIAWVKSLIHKYILYKKTREAGLLCEVIIFFLLGIPILLCGTFVDYYNFMSHIYSEDMAKVGETSKYPKISLAAFNKFHQLVN